MRHRSILGCALLVSFALPLAGCGDDPAGPAGHGTGGTEHGMVDDLVNKPGTVRLTDEMMERYVGLMKEARDVGTPTEAMLLRYRFNLREFAILSAVIGGSQARVGVAESRAQAEQALTKARADAETAEGTKKDMADLRVTMLTQQLEALARVAGASDIDRANVEVLRRWQPKLKALSRSK